MSRASSPMSSTTRATLSPAFVILVRLAHLLYLVSTMATSRKSVKRRGGADCLYSPSFRHGFFPETRLPLNTILGNWAYLTRKGCSAAIPLCDQRPYPSASQASPLHIV